MARAPKVKAAPRMTAQLDNAIGKALENRHTQHKVQALLFEKLKKSQIPIIESLAAEHLNGYAAAMLSNLTNGFIDETVTSPHIDTGVNEVFSPGSRGMPKWAPLAARTVRNKQSIRKYRRVWAHHIDPGMRLVTALSPALRRLQALKPKLEAVQADSRVIRVGGRHPKMQVHYVMVFTMGRAAGDPALFKIVMRNFTTGQWHQLEHGHHPSGGFRSARAGKLPRSRPRKPQPGAILYPEDLRPMLGPAAAIAGRVFRLKLRARLKS